MKQEKQGNREVLLNCALHMFYYKGYDAVSVQEIVDAAGLTKPTLYHYFKSKQGLLEVLVEEKGNVINHTLRCAGKKEGTIESVLKEVIRAQETMAKELKELYLFMFGSYFVSNSNVARQVVAPYMVEQFRIIKEIFDRHFNEQTNEERENYAIGFNGMMHYYILVRLQKEEEGTQVLSNDAMIDGLVNQFLYGIKREM